MNGSLGRSMFQCAYSFILSIFHHQSFVVQLPLLSLNVRTYYSDPLDMEGEQTWRNLLGKDVPRDACSLEDGPCGDSNVGEDLLLGFDNRNDLSLEGNKGRDDSSCGVGRAYAYKGCIEGTFASPWDCRKSSLGRASASFEVVQSKAGSQILLSFAFILPSQVFKIVKKGCYLEARCDSNVTFKIFRPCFNLRFLCFYSKPQQLCHLFD